MAEKRRLNSINRTEGNYLRNEGEADEQQEQQQQPEDRTSQTNSKRIKLHHYQHQQQPNPSTTTNNYHHRTKQDYHTLRPKPNSTNASMPPIHHPRSQQNQRMAEAALGRIIGSKPTANQNNPTHQGDQPQLTILTRSMPEIKNDEPLDERQASSSRIKHPIPSTSSASSNPLLDQIHHLKHQIETINKTVSSYKQVIESQTNLIDSITSSLSCNICLEILDSPYALLCGHIFCHKDLYAWFHRVNPSSTHDLDVSDEEPDHSHGIMWIQANESEASSGDLDRSGGQSSSDVNSTLIPGHSTISTTHAQDRPGGSATRRMNNNPNQATDRPISSFIRPFSDHQKKMNLVCPQCRAAVTTRPTALYAIKEAADRLKSDQTPSPSCAPSGSFRSQVELYRDEKDLTWGRLFIEEESNQQVDRPARRNRTFTTHLPPSILDVETGVRSCGRCSWAMGHNEYCARCGAYYGEQEGDSESDDESYHAPSVDSQDLGTDYESETSEDSDEEHEEGHDLWDVPMAGRTGSTFEWLADSDDPLPFGPSSHDEASDDGNSEIRVFRRRLPSYSYGDAGSEDDIGTLHGAEPLVERSSSTRSNRARRYSIPSSDESHAQSMGYSDEDHPFHCTGLAFVSNQHSSSSPFAHQEDHEEEEEEEDDDDDDHMNESFTSDQSDAGSLMTHHHHHRHRSGGSSSDRLPTTPDSGRHGHHDHVHHASIDSSDEEKSGHDSSSVSIAGVGSDQDEHEDSLAHSLSDRCDDNDGDQYPGWTDDDSF